MPYEKFDSHYLFEPVFQPKHSGGKTPLFDDVRLPFPTTLTELIGQDNPQDFTIPIVATVYGVKAVRYLSRAAKQKWLQWKLSGKYAWCKAKNLVGCTTPEIPKNLPRLEDYAGSDEEIRKANPFLNSLPEPLDPFLDQRLC